MCCRWVVITSASGGGAGVGVGGDCIRPSQGPDWSAPRGLIHELEDRARGSLIAASLLPRDSLPAGAPSPPSVPGEGSLPARDSGRRPGHAPLQGQSRFKMPSRSSDCFFHAVEVRFLEASHVSPKGGTPSALQLAQGRFLVLWISAWPAPCLGAVGRSWL